MNVGAYLKDTWRLIAVAVVSMGAVCFYGGVYAAVTYNHSTRPTEPVPEIGRTYPLDDHGHIVYLTQKEHATVNGLTFGGFCLVIVGSAVFKLRNRFLSRVTKSD